MPDFGNMAKKAREFASNHPDQVDEATDKANDFADDRTGDRYSDQIDKGEQKLDDYLGAGDGQDGQNQ